MDEIIIAIPSATGGQMRNIVEQCEASGIPYKTLPGLGELIDGRVNVKTLRDVDYQDLLGRPSVDLDTEAIGGYLTNKVVLEVLSRGQANNAEKAKGEQFVVLVPP